MNHERTGRVVVGHERVVHAERECGRRAVAALDEGVQPAGPGERGRHDVPSRYLIPNRDVECIALARVLHHDGEANAVSRIDPAGVRRSDRRGLGRRVDGSREVQRLRRVVEDDAGQRRTRSVGPNDALVHGHERPHQFEPAQVFYRRGTRVRRALTHPQLVGEEQVRRERIVAHLERDEQRNLRGAPLQVVLRSEIERELIVRRHGADRRVSSTSKRRVEGREVGVVGRIRAGGIEYADLTRQEAVRRRIADERIRGRRIHRHHRQRREVDELQLFEAADRQRVGEPIRDAVAGLDRERRVGRALSRDELPVDRVNLLRLLAVGNRDAGGAIVRPAADDRGRDGVDGDRGNLIAEDAIARSRGRIVYGVDQHIALIHRAIARGEVVAEIAVDLRIENERALSRAELLAGYGVVRGADTAVADFAADQPPGVRPEPRDQFPRDVELKPRGAIGRARRVREDRVRSQLGQRARRRVRTRARRQRRLRRVPLLIVDDARALEGSGRRGPASVRGTRHVRILNRERRKRRGRTDRVEEEPLPVAEHVAEHHVLEREVIRDLEVDRVAEQSLTRLNRHSGGEGCAGRRVDCLNCFLHRDRLLFQRVRKHRTGRGRPEVRLRQVAGIQRRPVRQRRCDVDSRGAVGALRHGRTVGGRTGRRLIAGNVEVELERGIGADHAQLVPEVVGERAVRRG